MSQWIFDSSHSFNNTDSLKNEAALLCVPERHMTCDSVGFERCWWCVPGKLQMTAGSGWSSWPDRGSSPQQGWAQRAHQAARSLRRHWSEPCSNPWMTDPEPQWRSPSEPPRYWPEPPTPAHTHTHGFSSELISADINTLEHTCTYFR